MHPEIHAELEFGYRNSIDTTSADMLDNLRIFATHDQEWRQVDQNILEARERLERVDAPGSAELQRSACHEVAAYHALWQGEWSQALDRIRQVLDALRGGQAPQRYAALWSYLASCIAYRLSQQTGEPALAAAATAYHEDARAAGRGTTWLSTLAAPVESSTTPPEHAVDPIDEQAMIGVLANAAQLAKPATFETKIENARAALRDTPRKPYEAALVVLGQLAGANPSEGDANATAAPDAIWIFGEATWVAWEAKSDAKPDGELGPDDVRQAGGHLRFTADKRAAAIPGDSVALLMTPQQSIHDSARAVADEHVYLVRPKEVLELFDRLVRAWRTARARNIESLSATDLSMIFHGEDALPSQWLPRLRSHPLRREPEAE